jgi:hypothetical protein
MANNDLKITKFQNGTAAAPGITFEDTSSGFFRNAANVFGWAANGVTSILFGLRTLYVCAYANSSGLRLLRAQGTEGSPTATTDGATIGDVSGYGHNGTAFAPGSVLRFIQDGAVSGSNVPMGILLNSRTSSGASTLALYVRANGNLEVKKSVTLGSAATDLITCTGRLILRQIANTTSKPGSLGEIVYNTGDSKVYVCTSASETAATWTALN